MKPNSCRAQFVVEVRGKFSATLSVLGKLRCCGIGLAGRTGVAALWRETPGCSEFRTEVRFGGLRDMFCLSFCTKNLGTNEEILRAPDIAED